MTKPKILPPTPERARLLASVKQKHTLPEIITRKALHALGYRYRLHDPKLPGRPDIVLKKYRLAIFVHGCFWHGHDCPHGARIPKHNREFWVEKIRANRERDERKKILLKNDGWQVMVVWECETKEANFSDRIARRMAKWKPHCQ